MAFRNLPLILVILSTTLFSLTQQAESESEPEEVEFPAWLGPNISSMGVLCDDGEKDEIGRKLGCTCKYPRATPSTDLIADCQSQTIGTEDTMLPRHLNVSLHVRTLNFAHNQFTHIDNSTFGFVEGIYELIFSYNLIHHVHGLNFMRLSKLDLSHNLMTNLTEDIFENCPKLQEIDLSFNQISFIEMNVFTVVKFLKKVNLASNHIGRAVMYYDEYRFTLSNLEYLEEVNLSNNSLTDFPTVVLNGSKTIKRLFLKNNQIASLSLPNGDAFHGEFFPNLEMLDLSGNFFNVITPNEFSGFKGLQKLMLDGNRHLTMIEKYGFSGLDSLVELSCERNRMLTYIDSLAFQADPLVAKSTNSTPRTVRLGGNGLAYIEFPLLPWKDLEDLDLLGNPWNCDCNLQWVASFRAQKSSEASILMDTDFACQAPPALRGMEVASVDPSEMLCFSDTATTVGIIGIIIFGVLLIVFAIFIALSTIGCLPSWLERCNLFGRGNELPKYSRVYPKPSGRYEIGSTASHDGGHVNETPVELEWDSAADVGR